MLQVYNYFGKFRCFKINVNNFYHKKYMNKGKKKAI